jgi:hypothetical protein
VRWMGILLAAPSVEWETKLVDHWVDQLGRLETRSAVRSVGLMADLVEKWAVLRVEK